MAKLQTVLRVTVTADFPFDALSTESMATVQKRAAEFFKHGRDVGAVNIHSEGRVLRTKVTA